MTDQPRRGPEYRHCQQPAVAVLVSAFGYEHRDGLSADFEAERSSESEVILTDRLTRKLREINGGITDDGIRQAVDALKLPVATGLLEANEKLYALLSRWVTVEEIDRGRPVGRSVRYIDFDNPERNEFLVVEEFKVKGPRNSRRLDLVVFINGIPAAVIECKDPADKHGMEHAVRDLLLYQDRVEGVPRLFHTVQLCVGMKKADAQYGTIETPLRRYARWKSTYPASKAEVTEQIGSEPTTQDILLSGMFRKGNLLDLIRNFIVFDRAGGRVVKKVARYQQFEAVNEAMRRILDRQSQTPMRDRGGVVWHTQGSGKSLTMLWLGVKLRRTPTLGNPTLMVVTDRRDLDRQITETFVNCGFENPQRAKRVRHLRQLLNGPPGQTIMTTVQKFRDEVDIRRGSMHPVLSDHDNIFVLVDEAHRSEYGLFNAHLRQALPNACLLAFTGTPISRTTSEFGSYIHKYTMPQSVTDEATVPILYESRLPELAVWGKQLDPIFEAQFRHLTEEQREALKKQEITERKVALAQNRVERIAFDIAEHYRQNFEPDGFKAQVVASSQEAAARYYAELSAYLPDRVALLISEPSAKDSKLHRVREPFKDEAEIISQFTKGSANQLAIIVVVDKYLTGFDAPIERVMYLDKPLRDHGLLQAIARVNRPLPERDKTWGLIVDYWGVSKFLDKALASFDDEIDAQEVLQQRDDDEAYEDLRQKRKEVFGCFPDGLSRDDMEPWVLALEEDDDRAMFLERYRAFYTAIERLLPDPRALKFLGDFAWLRRIRRELVAQYSEEDLIVADSSEKVRRLIDDHIRTEDIRVLLEPVEILSEKFEQEMEKLHSDRAKASRMEHAVSREITMKMHEDPAFYESIRDRLERIIAERKQKRIDDAKEYQLLMALRGNMKEERGETAESLGLSPKAFAFYGLLMRSSGDDGVPEEELRSLSQEILSGLEEQAVIDWVHKEEIQREMRRIVKRRLRLSNWPVDQLEETTTEIMDLARVRLTR